MKSIDKLRASQYVGQHMSLSEIADEIEAEIERDYMLLPVDADGVPIHVGDEIQYVNEQGGTGAKVKVCAIADGYTFYDNGKHIHAYSSDSTRHVLPRTLEDVLIEYRLKAYNLYADQELTGDERVDEFKKLDAEYDSGIRELLGGDAE